MLSCQLATKMLRNSVVNTWINADIPNAISNPLSIVYEPLFPFVKWVTQTQFPEDKHFLG